MNRFTSVFAMLAIALSQFSWSADSSPPPVFDTEMANARALIDKNDWAAALHVLESYTQAKPGSADGFNLLGYSLRNLKRYDESLLAYKQALKLDPAHRGAHEYIGVAYIHMGQLAKAKEHLDALDKLCTFSCEEYRDLKKALADASKAKSS